MVDFLIDSINVRTLTMMSAAIAAIATVAAALAMPRTPVVQVEATDAGSRA